MSELDSHFGLCPRCADEDRWNEGELLNYGRDHWIACHEHEVRWYVGANLFSSWREETDEVWKANAERIGTYIEVEAAHLAPLPEGVVIYPNLLEQRMWLQETLEALPDPGFPAEEVPF